MPFALPHYEPPDFNAPVLCRAPLARFEPAPADGVVPDGYHATSIFPEYFHLSPGLWRLAADSRMDCVVSRAADGSLLVKEFRRVRSGELIAVGRGENGEEGIYVHAEPFPVTSEVSDKFAFRTRVSRETSFSIDYDELYPLLHYERKNGFILWVLGPAVTFDRDARDAFAGIVSRGYAHGLLAGNALAVHDTEASLFRTALGQDIYSKRLTPLGHYKHLDTINTVRRIGGLREAVRQGLIKDGIMRSVILRDIPMVLAGSIRDDGPLPDVIADVYEAQDRMRALARQATTVIAMATQLHSIATGNMIPSFRVMKEKEAGEETIRPVYFYTVDMSEFAANKLADRGSLSARSILTNAQDFIVTLDRGLKGYESGAGQG